MKEYLFIAEKPSLAKEIAHARAEQKGVKASKNNLYWSVGDDAVTWLFGHMYETALPEAYDPKYSNWRLEYLPIIPDKWKLNLHNDKREHVSGIKKLMNEYGKFVNAGDAAREGQLLVDELLIENGCDPFSDKTLRLWVRSVARKDLLDALNNMEPNKNKEFLYNSAICRQRADWLHGINLSMLYTIKAQQGGARGVVSVGRVQTPTLKIVVDRDREIENFKPVDHFLPTGLFIHKNGKFSANYIIPDDMEGLDSEGRLINKNVAQEIVDRVKENSGKIEDFKSQDKSTTPPLPFSLSALQTECSSKFGLSAQETLDVAQKLYETYKVTTYPRSDSRYLPTSILKDESPKIVENLKGIEGNIGVSAKDSNIKLKSSAWNDSKISDHHAIIPTVEANSSKLKSLNQVERGVFELIAKSFIAQFYPNHRYKSLSAIVDFNGDKFKATGKQVIDNGWKNVYQNEKQQDETDEDSQSLPSMSKNDPVEIEKVENKAKQTKPPARFSDGTLIAAMTNMHKFVTDPEIKKKLKENDGLGTEATRSSIIEKLIKRNFITRKGKKQIISTDTGRSVIDALPIEIVDPGLTAVWEGYLNSVSDGKIGPDKFMQVQIKTLKDRVEKGKLSEVKIKGKKIRPLDGHGEACTKCGEGTMITREINKGKNKGKRFLACDKYPDCENIKWEQEKIEPIKGHGETCNKCGEGTMTTRKINNGDNKGKKFLACDKYPECKNAVWPQPNVKPVDGDGKECPTCGKGKLVTKKSKNGNLFLACNQYPECKHMEWPETTVEKISGDGETCTKCNKGIMVTRKINKGDNKGKSFLACNSYPDCKNTVWPDN